jgi:hypothetical protein
LMFAVRITLAHLYQPSKALTLEWHLLTSWRRDSLVPGHF